MPNTHVKRTHMAVYLVLERWRQKAPYGLLASQSTQSRKLRVLWETLPQKNMIKRSQQDDSVGDLMT